jgi:hypothetical protein
MQGTLNITEAKAIARIAARLISTHNDLDDQISFIKPIRFQHPKDWSVAFAAEFLQKTSPSKSNARMGIDFLNDVITEQNSPLHRPSLISKLGLSDMLG